MRKIKNYYNLNWKHSPEDQRDFRFMSLMTTRKDIFKVDVLPTSSDCSNIIPEIYDQGMVGSCTGNSVSMAGLYQSRKQDREIFPSRLMLYYNGRIPLGDPITDDGAYLRDVIKGFAKYGSCSELDWPYDEFLVNAKPSDDAYVKGEHTKAIQYYSLDTTILDEMKNCIASGHPFVFGFNVYTSFFGSWVDTMPIPGVKERLEGGHAVLAVGYDDSRKAVKIKNSWGIDWKDGGYFWMPYDFFLSDNCGDAWMVTGLTATDVVVPDTVGVVDLKKVFFSLKAIKKMAESEIVAIGQQMGLNTDIKKSKSHNATIVAGALGIK